MNHLYLSHGKDVPAHGEYHYLDVGDVRLFLITDSAERHVPPSLEPLPHLIDPEPISADHARHLKPLGIKPGHTALDVLKTARQIHPLFKP